MNAQTAQPKWGLLIVTDYSRILVDETGQYPPEMEIAEDLENGMFAVFRFPLPQLKNERGHLVTLNYADDWPHPLPDYDEWFAASLAAVARAHGATKKELSDALCSADPYRRAWAYECIGSYHGFENFDSPPRILSKEEVDTLLE